jgi:NAD(P)-dependent dehydrogenase (short-subunit alcohol dehydrogenase family)
MKEGFEVITIGRHASSPSGADNRPNRTQISSGFEDDSAIESVIDEISALHEKVYGFLHLARDKANLNGPNSSRANWLQEFALGAYVPYRLGRALAQRVGLRRLIVASSVYGSVAQRPKIYENSGMLNPHYGATKAAVNQMVRDLSVQLAPDCQVNGVAWGGISSNPQEELERAYSEENPSGRMLSLAEAYGPIRFLLSSYSSGMTGQHLVVDGGWSVW